jgi:acyl-CoA thioesterase FadM
LKAITTLSQEFDAKGKRRQVWPEERIIVTANLNINYRAPTKVNQFVVVKTVLTEVNDHRSD